MPFPSGRVPVPGSRRFPLVGARPIGPADPAERVEVTVVVRRRPDAHLVPHGGTRLGRADFAAAAGAHPADVAAVEAFAWDADLEVVAADPIRRTLTLAGSVAALGRAFGVRLERWEHAGGTYRGRTGPIFVPAHLGGIVEGVFGLDDRTQADPHFRLLDPAAAVGAHATPYPGFLPTEVACLYRFPAHLDGAGQTIALIELGGGFRSADCTAAFAAAGLPVPEVVTVSVDGAGNAPTGDPASADGEVALDIQVAGATAPGARLAVYFAPNSERGFLDAVATAVHDARLAPTILSISWGGPEEGWTAQGLAALDAVFQDAAALGVTVCCASGDNGSDDRVGDGHPHTDFPASSPHVLACGGTRLEVRDGHLVGEVAWNAGLLGGATGGGVSRIFALPPWQRRAGVPPACGRGARRGRGVPDVSGDADPRTGYRVVVDGTFRVIGGTSAVAPLWAGLVARCNQALGTSLGFLCPLLYGDLGGALRDITEGDNGAYAAGPGWDACTGLGSPDGAAILAALQRLRPPLS